VELSNSHDSQFMSSRAFELFFFMFVWMRAKGWGKACKQPARMHAREPGVPK
jgi:hypothetical protein